MSPPTGGILEIYGAEVPAKLKSNRRELVHLLNTQVGVRYPGGHRLRFLRNPLGDLSRKRLPRLTRFIH